MSVASEVLDLDKLAFGDGAVVPAEVSLFKEGNPLFRVVADSQLYITYTLKLGKNLRVLSRADNRQTSLKLHSTPITDVKFVNYRSNVAASASEGEFFVWLVTMDDEASGQGTGGGPLGLTIRTYFKLTDAVTIQSFSWYINSATQRPDLLVRYGDTAGVLMSSELIALYDNKELQTTLAKSCKILRTIPGDTSSSSAASTVPALTSVGNGGWFAFTVDPVMVVVCTARNPNTPAWRGCESEVVTGLELLQTSGPANLITASNQAVYQWVIKGDSEPVLQRKLTHAPGIVAIRSSNLAFAVFNKDRQCYVVQVSDDKQNTLECCRFALQGQVNRVSIAFNQTAESFTILTDYQTRLTQQSLKIPQAAVAVTERRITRAAVTAAPSESSGSGNSIIKNLMNQISQRQLGVADSSPSSAPSIVPATGAKVSIATDPAVKAAVVASIPRPEQYSPVIPTGVATQVSSILPGAIAASPSSVTVSAATPAAGSGSTEGASTSSAPQAVIVPRPTLANSSLPAPMQDGLLAAAVGEGQDDVKRAYSRLQSVLSNATQILQLVPETIRHDHEQLLNLSLEAQMTQLQKDVGASGSASQSAGGFPTSKDSTVAFDSYFLTTLMESVAQKVVSGMVEGLDESLRLQLDHGVRNAMSQTLRNAQRQSMRKQVDDAIAASATSFAKMVKQRFETLAAQELAESMGGLFTSINELISENTNLQAELRLIHNCGVLSDIQNMRRELRELREEFDSLKFAAHSAPVSGANPSTFQGYNPTPETLLTTANGLMQDGQCNAALEYLLRVNQPLLMLMLLSATQPKDDLYVKLLNDPKVADATWVAVLAQCASAASSPQDYGMAAQLMVDVIAERENLLAREMGLVTSLGSFIPRAKQNVQGESARVVLHLEKELK